MNLSWIYREPIVNLSWTYPRCQQLFPVWRIKCMKIMEFGLKWVHMAWYELILRLDGALWLTIIFKPLLTQKGLLQSRLSLCLDVCERKGLHDVWGHALLCFRQLNSLLLCNGTGGSRWSGCKWVCCSAACCQTHTLPCNSYLFPHLGWVAARTQTGWIGPIGPPRKIRGKKETCLHFSGPW